MEKVQWNSINKMDPPRPLDRSKTGTKERSHDGLSLPNQNTISINKIWYYYTRYGKSTIK